jgi:hypothetical protein
VAVTVSLPSVPAVNVAAPVGASAGGWWTVRVNGCVASGRKPLVAVMVNAKLNGPVPRSGGVPVRRPVVAPI